MVNCFVRFLPHFSKKTLLNVKFSCISSIFFICYNILIYVWALLIIYSFNHLILFIMKNPNTKQENKKQANVIVKENEILTALNDAVIEKPILVDVITEKEKEKTAKREKAEQMKQLRKEKTQAKNDAVDFWMYQTRSKTAVKKFCQNNESIIMPYINKINLLYDTNFDIGVINGTLENFAFIHELNVVDIDGQIIDDKKDIVSIKFYLDLLDRKAKYIDFSNDDFVKFSAKRTFNKCASATKTQIAKIKLINKAELSQAKYNSAIKTFDKTQTENLSNSALIYFLHKCFNDVKNPEIVPTKNLAK